MRKILKHRQQRGKLFRQEGATFRAVTKIVKIRHVDSGILPYVTTTSLRLDSKKSKKGGAKGSVALMKETIQLGCVSKDYPGRKSVLREVSNLGSNHTVKFSKSTWHHIKIRERTGPSRGVIQHCEPHERSPCATRFEERSQEETLHQKRFDRRVAWELAKNIYKLKNADKATFYTSVESRAVPAPTSKSADERALRLIPEHQCT